MSNWIYKNYSVLPMKKKCKNRHSYPMTLFNSPRLENKQHLQLETTWGYLLLFGEHFKINTKSFSVFLKQFFKIPNHEIMA